MSSLTFFNLDIYFSKILLVQVIFFLLARTNMWFLCDCLLSIGFFSKASSVYPGLYVHWSVLLSCTVLLLRSTLHCVTSQESHCASNVLRMMVSCGRYTVKQQGTVIIVSLLWTVLGQNSRQVCGLHRSTLSAQYWRINRKAVYGLEIIFIIWHFNAETVI